MQPGQILVAKHGSTQVIKLVGDVRLTLCVSFDNFIEKTFNGDGLSCVVFDLTGATAVDSTTLGLMAKIAILSKERCDLVPVVFSTNTSVNRLLEIMGFDDIFEIIHESHEFNKPCRHITLSDIDEESAKERVIEAHEILMQLNDSNKEAFKDLMKTLEAQ
ncbi:MAG: STAS domain-containing protein [Cellvibrionaceae bacterium]